MATSNNILSWRNTLNEKPVQPEIMIQPHTLIKQMHTSTSITHFPPSIVSVSMGLVPVDDEVLVDTRETVTPEGPSACPTVITY